MSPAFAGGPPSGEGDDGDDDDLDDAVDDGLDDDDEEDEDGDEEDSEQDDEADDSEEDDDVDPLQVAGAKGRRGVGSFQNTDADAWVAELVESDGAELVETALDDVVEGDPDGLVDAATAAIAIAAAEVVAAARGKPRKDIPESVRSWTKAKHLAHHYDLGRRARLAVERVLQDSELADAWDETGDADAWRADVEGLLGRLVKDPS